MLSASDLLDEEDASLWRHHRLDGPGPFTRQPIEYMGRARLLDELSSKWDRRRVHGPAHLLDSSSSRWDRARFLDKQ